MLKPILEKCTVHSSFVCQRNYHISFALSRYDTNSLVLFSADSAIYRFSTRRTGIVTVQILVYAGFINVDNLVLGEFGYGLYKRFSLLFIAFLVPGRLFLRVIPSLIKASLTASSVQPNTSPISRR